MSSGVGVDDECCTEFDDMKLGSKKSRCIMYKIQDKKTIKVDKKIEKHCVSKDHEDSDQEEHFKEIIRDLPRDEGRYIVWDLHVKDGMKGTEADKLVLMNWCPDQAKIGEKMIFASSKDALKKKLNGIHAIVDANDEGDLEYCEVMKKAAKK